MVERCVDACERDEEKVWQPIFGDCDCECESVAVRITRATRRTLYRLRLIPICTRRGKWRLRVAPRLLNRPSSEDYGFYVVKGNGEISFGVKGTRRSEGNPNSIKEFRWILVFQTFLFWKMIEGWFLDVLGCLRY